MTESGYSLVCSGPGKPWRIRNRKTRKFVGREHATLKAAVTALNKLLAK